MFQTVDELLKSWNYEASLTQKVLDQLTDESLKQEIAAGHWSLGQLSWHLVTTLGVFAGQIGLELEGPSADAPVPTHAKDIAKEYQIVTQSLSNTIKTQWNDEQLSEIKSVFGHEQRCDQVFSLLISHQNHHRGQMTVLMRQAGLRVPGVYGPSKEEWESNN